MLKSLTGLRFYAALLVFFSHLYLFNFFSGLTDGWAFKFLTELGWVGVSLFFTLSGFVLFINYLNPSGEKHCQNIWEFYLARFARIYPVFLFTTLFAVPLEWMSPDQRPFWTPLAFNLTMTHCFEPHACGAFNSVGWSLSHESVFYALFPALGLLFLKPKPLRLVIIILGAYLLYILALVAVLPGTFYAQGNFALNRVGEFLLGMTAGHLYLQYRGHPKMEQWLGSRYTQLIAWMVISTCLAIMGLRTVFMSPYPLIDQTGFLLYPIPAFLIILTLAMLEDRGFAPAFMVHPWVLRGGEISYSFYLIHHLLMRYSLHVSKMLFGLDLRTFGMLEGIPVILALMVGSLGAAYCMHRWVEIPYRQKILTAFKPSKNAKALLPSNASA